MPRRDVLGLTLALFITTLFTPIYARLQLLRRDASTVIASTLAENDEGENHDPLDVPTGATLESVPVGDGDETLAVYWSENPDNESATHVYIMVHGRLRNGNDYWTIMNDALQSAIDDDYPGVDTNAIVTAPQFFSTDLNSGEYSAHQLAWGDVNAWQAGDIATHPSETTLSSMDALDAMLSLFADKSTYPSVTNITLVGHGGGGQLVTRYAAVGSLPSGVHARIIVGDASTHAYFTEHRPAPSDPTAEGCELWNTWRYGYDNFTGTATGGNKSAEEYFTQYISRDIVFMVAENDTAADGDQFCPALMQGGIARRDRNLAWWTYINTLARTDEPVQLFGFSSNFTDTPDWSANGTATFLPRLIVVEDATHDAAEVFGGSDGRAALFRAFILPEGWRPDGYDDAISKWADDEEIQSASNVTTTSSSSQVVQPTTTVQHGLSASTTQATSSENGARSSMDVYTGIGFVSFLIPLIFFS